MKKPIIIRGRVPNRLLKRYGYVFKGLAFYPFIYVTKNCTRATLNHEKIHWSQQKRDGLIKFFVHYIAQYRANRKSGMDPYNAYRFIDYEIEAFDNQHNPYYWNYVYNSKRK